MLFGGKRFAARLGYNLLADMPTLHFAQSFYGTSTYRFFSSTASENKFNFFDFGSKMTPHPEKAYKGGEDALFTNKNVLCVADGVGGWAEVGVDPGLYSKKLCKNVQDCVSSSWDIYKISPRQLIIDAADKNKEIGSSTVCVVILDEQRPLIHTALIGDSSYLLLRKIENNLKVIIHSQEQQREFNFPYQIGSEGDPPQIAEVSRHQVENNDILVVGTDGLFDNLDDQQIINVLKPFLTVSDELPDPSLVAEMIADLAYKYSIDLKYNSPFAKKARAAFYDFRGGKSDDITVVVGQVKLIGRQKSVDQEKFEDS